jgi:hypothetical protein
MKKALLTERSLLIFCIALGAAEAWISRYDMISDGVAYLDIGDAYLRGDWNTAVNAYWSPAYSWLLGLALHFLRPSIAWEFVTLHLVNLIIYLAALLCFRFLIHSILRSLREDGGSGSDCVPLPECALLWLGYGIFLWCSLVLIDIGKATPDLLVAALVFLLAGYLVDLRVHHSYGEFAMFGVLGGAAYLSKTVMFPLGFGFLLILFFSGKVSKRRVYGVLLSALAFLIVSAPFVVVLSRAKGRLTFGDSGKLSYAALVSPKAPQVHWQGDPAGSGIPKHPTRKLMEDIPVFEFAEPVGGTYPPWYDPSYWNEGVRGKFRLRSQILVLVQSALAYEKVFLGELGLLAGAGFFLFAGGDPTRRGVASNWPLLALACLTFVLYSLVLVLNRYIGAAMVLLWMAIFAGVRLPKDDKLERAAKLVAAAVAITVVLSVAGHLAESLYTSLTVGVGPSSRDHVKVALGLESMGLRTGDRVAVIGEGMTNHWARLGRFKIVAEVELPGDATQEFWSSSLERRNSVYERLSHTGARAVIAWEPPHSAREPRWQRISDTGYYAYSFPK